jgi:hypothetical protein
MTTRHTPHHLNTTNNQPRKAKPVASVFAEFKPVAYPYNFAIELTVPIIAGGTPSDPRVAEGWLKSKLGVDKDDLIREAAAEVMVERGISLEEAVKEVNINKHLNGFKRDPNTELSVQVRDLAQESGEPAAVVNSIGELYIEGRQAKAAIKEAANVRWPKERWGPSRKGTLSFFAEHVFVPETRIYLGTTDPNGINQRFVHTFRGSGIQYEEYVEQAKLQFTVTTDHDFSAEQWALLWLTGEQQGIGASRSQGYGKYEVTKWNKIKL